MIRADSATVIERPPQAVFDFVATGFFRNYPRWSPEVVQLVPLSPGPLAVGALGRQVRIDYGRRTEATFRVTRLEPCAAVAFEGLSTPFTIAYAFVPFGAHTRVTLSFQLLRLEFLMRPFERLIGSAVRDSVASTTQRLKTVAEREIVLPVASPVPLPPSLALAAAAPAEAEPPASTLPPAAEPGAGFSRA